MKDKVTWNTHLLLVQDFHGVELLCSFEFYQHDSAKGASAQRFQSVKVI